MITQLHKGEFYKIHTRNNTNFPGNVRYVRREYLPSTEEEWETFFIRLPQNNPEGFLKRFRIPVKDIYSVYNKHIFSERECICKNIEYGNTNWLGEEKSPIVKSWLKEVEKIEKGLIVLL